MWKQSSKLSGAVIVTVLLGSGCATTPEGSSPQAPAAVTPALEAQYHQAIESMKAGQWEAAIVGLESITQENDRLSGPYLNLGIAYANSGDTDKAAAALLASLDRNPVNPLACNQLGILYRRSGRFDQARQMYENALQADPAYADAHWNLGILHDLYLQQPGQALQHYERYQQLTGSDDPQLRLWIAGPPAENQDGTDDRRRETAMNRRCGCIFLAVALMSPFLPVGADESLELEGATITGNRELPKALHIVPWKAAVPGNSPAAPCRAWWMKSWRPWTAMS